MGCRSHSSQQQSRSEQAISQGQGPWDLSRPHHADNGRLSSAGKPKAQKPKCLHYRHFGGCATQGAGTRQRVGRHRLPKKAGQDGRNQTRITGVWRSMRHASLTPDQTDALQEIVNVAMGQAGDSLARVMDSFVRLSVPRIRLIEVSKAASSIADMVGDSEIVTAVRQSFYDQLRGAAITLFSAEGCRDLAELMGYYQSRDEQTEKEILFDISNILVGACLNGIADQLGSDLSFSSPSMRAARGAPGGLRAGGAGPGAGARRV